ncbi:LuxR C-terminal-related transcriptional regulator [cf. Phormidesmis sp. LEGE 11477]|uniref:LuxR C-terminal-related transcriptional regulator n=1 Tax=cf. Phormidesmis sp. LEGE 11477 TaxID=1828680 RepID=UPI001882B69E|nr:LuxR C-terminal-related transcriptional regulator [cf. Phormidesmis sp. LEGE 11477]MBE9060764.1 LuxR family transcriptional regulator [cf. Phormidesmis sp. LEGE 11477]
MTSLQPLFEAIEKIDDEAQMRSQLAPQLEAYFEAKRSGIFFFDQEKTINPKIRQVLDIVLSTERNPLARYIAERHTPVHEEMVTTPKAWRLICPRLDHWHVMAGPIIHRGQIIGSVGCTRDQTMPAFNTQNVANLSAICLHLSVRTTAIRTAQSSPVDSFSTNLTSDHLTPREIEIANLVALGKTNAEIGTELWITENSVKQALKRMFRKLKVSSRTQMVTQLSRTKRLL